MIKRFLKFVEIRTKVTTSCSFLLAMAYLLSLRQNINWKLTIVFFFSMMIIDLATTAINNYMDTKSNGQQLQFERPAARRIIGTMIIVSVIGGLYLFYLTDWIVLLLGGFCFLCGLLYTWGPVPISTMPLGEVISGLIQGGVGPFILLYINMPAGTYLKLAVRAGSVIVSLKIVPLITVLLFTMPPMCGIANIMLANNICDRERDEAVHRYTLAFYLGRNALNLFAGLYYAGYIATFLLVILKLAHPILLLSLLTVFPVHRNIKKFFLQQDKEKTFPLSITNYLIMTGANTILFLVSCIHYI